MSGEYRISPTSYATALSGAKECVITFPVIVILLIPICFPNTGVKTGRPLMSVANYNDTQVLLSENKYSSANRLVYLWRRWESNPGPTASFTT
jgi:hypothetical protein